MTYGNSMDYTGLGCLVLTNQINWEYMEIREFLLNQIILEEEKVRLVGWMTRVHFGYLEDMAGIVVINNTFLDLIPSIDSLKSLNDLWRYDGNWTWISGNSVGDQNAYHGTKGVASPSNNPGSRYRPANWIDSNGNFWLFGGSFSNSNSLYSYLLVELIISGYFNDLWKFDGEEWVWAAGTNASNQNGVYGENGIPDSNNIPGGRDLAVSWMDNFGNFWMFGGRGYDSSGSSIGNAIHVKYKHQL
jgi:hypothetical protein